MGLHPADEEEGLDKWLQAALGLRLQLEKKFLPWDSLPLRSPASVRVNSAGSSIAATHCTLGRDCT